MTTIQESPLVPLPHPEAAEKLSHIAMLHELPSDSRPKHINYFSDINGGYISGKFHVESAIDADMPDWISDLPEYSERSNALEAVRNIVVGETVNHPVGEEIDWMSAADRLLDKAREMPDGPDRDNVLVGSVLSSQFAPSMVDRAKYLKNSYSENMQADLAKACERSDVVMLLENDMEITDEFVIGTYRLHGIKEFASVFSANEDDVNIYVDNVVALADHEEKTRRREGLPTVKRMQKNILADQEDNTESSAENREQAVTVSMSGEKVTGSILDLHKIERFALQEIYIKRQMADVFDGMETGLSSFDKMIKREGDRKDRAIALDDFDCNSPTIETALRKQLTKLNVDVSESFMLLSERASKEFSLDGVDLTDRAQLTRSQQVALRYQEVRDIIDGHMEAAKFIDPHTYSKRQADEVVSGFIEKGAVRTIDGLSVDGGAAPDTCVDIIKNIMRDVINDPALEATVTPEELRDFAHANRRRLLMFATGHISEFLEVDLDNALRLTSEGEKPKIIRDENGKLQFKNDLLPLAKESLDVYSAVILGCPVLRLQHPNRALLTVQEKAALGSSNYIDHTLASMINAAYDRGIFSVAALRAQAADLLTAYQEREQRKLQSLSYL